MEYCEKCWERPVAIQVTKIVNGEKTVTKLCRECAAQEGANLPGGVFGQALLGLLGQDKPAAPVGGVKVPAKCPACGLEFASFAKNSMLGCAQCYDTFLPALLPMLRRIQGSVTHRGARPADDLPAPAPDAPRDESAALQARIDALRQRLQQAIETEEYEQAATLRDEIKALQEGAQA